MSKSVWDMAKIPKKYNRKAKLHGVVKSIRDLYGWNKIITKMRKGKESPMDPYIEQILHECVDVLKEAENSEARRLTGLARDLLLFSVPWRSIANGRWVECENYWNTRINPIIR